MLAVSALMTAANTVAAALSPSACRTPSRNPCMVRVEKTRYRNDPYGFCVLPSKVQPAAMAAAQPASAVYAQQQPQPVFTAVASTRTPMPVAAAVMPVAPVAASPMRSAAKKSGAIRYAFVDFKQESKTFIAPFKISVGDIVVVEGDRGENIGTVSEITTVAPTYEVPCKVIRRATERDLAQLDEQRAKEADAVAKCQSAVETLGLRATVVDCEFQFDLNKLTIFVQRPSKKFVDFRKLQRGLFRDFRCRIWLSYMDEVEAARAAPRTQ